MLNTGFELLWLFFIYSFFGWVLETAVAAVRQKRFVNRGWINGPFCVIYGLAAVVITVSLDELSGFWLFLGSMILATVIEWITGHLIEKMYHERWWDYSNIRWNFDGYVCLPVSIFWGFLGVVIMKWGNKLTLDLFYLCPSWLGKTIIWVLAAVLAVDALASYVTLAGRSKYIEQWEAADNYLTGVSTKLGRWITNRIVRRMKTAYPETKPYEARTKEKTVFAEGCDFYKIIMLFFIGSFLGDITETVFCRITAGIWMSRSSVVWGPFSIVWGLAIAVVTAILYKYRDHSDVFLFSVGTFLGGAYEYLCSVFTEIVFGTVFWDYSKMPFNLGGRINLLYCFFWGFAAVIWFKKLYPIFSKWIEKIPIKIGIAVTWALIVFMSLNIIVSCMALVRYDQRSEGVQAVSYWQKTIDMHYGDEKMERIYPNAKKA